MASIREVSGLAEDLLCPVCLSIFQDPRMLGCGHNFCLSCLESCIISKGQLQGTCPECRGPFNLQDAVCNRVLANLSEKARLLKLEEGCQSGVSGSWHICGEHEEPLKLFCSQDEAPVCVICRDLPQHQGHNFLPIKNAVNSYREKLKTSLDPLEDGVKWATNNQSRQLETMEELEDLTQNLCGLIFISFEELREILNEREQNMMETVKQMKENNQAEMERNVEHLKDYELSHHETICSIQAALEETNDFAFLKEIKELMGRIQDRLRKENEEKRSDADEDGQRVMGGDHEDTSEYQAEEGKGDEATSDKGKAYEKQAQDATEGEDGAIVPVNPALGELEELLNFESWKDLLRRIDIAEMLVPGSPILEEDVLPSEDSNIFEEAEGKETTVGEQPEGKTSALGMGSLDRLTPLPTSVSSTASTMGKAHYKAPHCLPTFSVPLFRPLSFYSNSFMRGGRSWTPYPRWPCGIIPQSRGGSQRQPFCSSRGQGRGNNPDIQRSHPSEGSYSHQDSRKSPRREPGQPGGVHGWRPAQDYFNKQRRPQSSGGNIPGQSEGESRPAHVSGQGGREFNKQRPQSSMGNSSGQSGGQSVKKESPQSRGGHTSGRGGSRRGRGAAKKGGGASAGSQGDQNRHQASQCGGHGGGGGSGSAKGPQNK